MPRVGSLSDHGSSDKYHSANGLSLWELRDRHPSEYGNNSSPRSQPASPTLVSDPESRSPSPRPIPPPRIIPRHLLASTAAQFRNNLTIQLNRLHRLTRKFHVYFWPTERAPELQPIPFPFGSILTNSIHALSQHIDQLESIYCATVEEDANLPLPFLLPDEINPVALDVYKQTEVDQLATVNSAWAQHFIRYPNFVRQIFHNHRLAIAHQIDPPRRAYTYALEIPHPAAIENLEYSIRSHCPSWVDIAFLPPNDPFRQHYPLTARITYYTDQRPRPTVAFLDILNNGTLVARFSHNGLLNAETFSRLPPEIRFGLCVYLIDHKDWCTYLVTGHLHILGPLFAGYHLLLH
ncbi:hypothetical protein BN946_scf185029.g2 [Trametes cinnabarina]|uniref:Uncharacterized protein n=1 Tax=Pycnoporus cinnabarinus TaxID=5643 RepID=A0A060SYZ7_PYCCI|nr:hypothetical protein BN946_scf185029.g2 [Trametes cinnabarina]